MFNTKKSQQAMEFMVIFIFVLAIIGLASYVLGIYLIDYKEKDTQNRADNFAQNIEKEIEILGNVERGYYRELEIYNKNYYVDINDSYLIIEDLETNVINYYEIKGNFTINIFNRSTDYGEIRVISFEK